MNQDITPDNTNNFKQQTNDNSNVTEDIESNQLSDSSEDTLPEIGDGNKEFIKSIGYSVIFLSNIKSDYSEEELFKRIGFYCETLFEGDSIKAFENVKSAYVKSQEDNLQKLENQLLKFKQRKEEQITWANERIEKEKSSKDNEVKKLEERKQVIEKDLNELNSELFKAKEEYTKEKKNIVTNQITEAHNAVNQISENFKKVYETKSGINQQEYEKLKKGIDSKIEFLKKKLERFESLHDSILPKIKNLSKDGISPYVYNFLVWSGFLGVFVSGWFYSIYALEKKLSNDSIIFF